jgi:hypothetical protein
MKLSRQTGNAWTAPAATVGPIAGNRAQGGTHLAASFAGGLGAGSR